MFSQNSSRVVFLTALVWAACLFVVPYGLHILLYYINLAINYRLDPFTNGFIPAMIFGLTLAGGLAGYWTARQLKQAAYLPALRRLPVILGWAVAMLLSVYTFFILSSLFMPQFSTPLLPGEPEPVLRGPPLFIRILARDFVVSMIPGLLGGLVLGWQIWRKTKMNAWKMVQVTAGWGLGFGLGGMLGRGLANLFFVLSPSGFDPGWIVMDLITWLSYGITGFIGGAAGAWVTVQVIQSVAENREKESAGFQATHS